MSSHSIVTQNTRKISFFPPLTPAPRYRCCCGKQHFVSILRCTSSWVPILLSRVPVRILSHEGTYCAIVVWLFKILITTNTKDCFLCIIYQRLKIKRGEKMYDLKKVIGKKSNEFTAICKRLKIIFKSWECKQLNFWKFKLKYQEEDKQNCII